MIYNIGMSELNNKPVAYLFIGTSGVGKSTAMKLLKDYTTQSGMSFLDPVTITGRKLRFADDKANFINKETKDKRLALNKTDGFIERSSTVKWDYAGSKYCLNDDRIIQAIVERKGFMATFRMPDVAERFKEVYGDYFDIKTVLVTAPIPEIRKRLQNDSSRSATEIEQRMNLIVSELDMYDQLIASGEFKPDKIIQSTAGLTKEESLAELKSQLFNMVEEDTKAVVLEEISDDVYVPGDYIDLYHSHNYPNTANIYEGRHIRGDEVLNEVRGAGVCEVLKKLKVINSNNTDDYSKIDKVLRIVDYEQEEQYHTKHITFPFDPVSLNLIKAAPNNFSAYFSTSIFRRERDEGSYDGMDPKITVQYGRYPLGSRNIEEPLYIQEINPTSLKVAVDSAIELATNDTPTFDSNRPYFSTSSLIKSGILVPEDFPHEKKLFENVSKQLHHPKSGRDFCA